MKSLMKNTRGSIQIIVDALPIAVLGITQKPKRLVMPYVFGLALFIFFFRQSIWHQVYDAKIYDEGFISDMIWRNLSYGTNLLVPSNFLYFHFSPILWIFGALSFFWPSDQISWFAFFFALQPTLTFVALTRLFSKVSSLYPHKILRYTSALVLSVGGGFLGTLGYPHWEFWAIPLLLFALDMLSEKRFRLSFLLFTLALLVKEDISAYVAMFIVGLFWFSPLRSNALKVAVILCSITAFYTGIRSLAIDAPSLFEESYLGSPPLGHLNLSFFADRIEILLQEQLHLFLPIIGLVVVSLVLNPQNVKAILITSSPIFFVSLVAYSPTIGTFQLYYGFSTWMIFIFLVFVLMQEDEWKNVKVLNPKPYSLFVVCLGLVFLGSSIFSHLVTGAISSTPTKAERSILTRDLLELTSKGWGIDTAISVPIAGKFLRSQLVDDVKEIQNCTIVSNTATQFSQKILGDSKELNYNIVKKKYYSIVSPPEISCVVNLGN